jgi:hypothetical protein
MRWLEVIQVIEVRLVRPSRHGRSPPAVCTTATAMNGNAAMNASISDSRDIWDAAADLALFFAGEPDAKVLATLNQTRKNLQRDLTDTIGAEMAAQIAESFCGAVMGHKHELEAKGGGSA